MSGSHLDRCARAACRTASAGLAAAVLIVAPAAAQDSHVHNEEEAHEHDHASHFTHPLFTESISPDTKLRVDYSYLVIADGSTSEMELEGEYAFAPVFSIEAGVHFEPDPGQLGETHVTFKFANHAFEDAGVLLGYGLQLGLPTGTAHDHGRGAEPDDHSGGADENIYELTPFLNAGWRRGAWEAVAWTLFDIPTNQGEQEEVGTGLRYNTSFLLHASARIDGLVEAFGETGLSGPETDMTSLNVAPGVRVRPVMGSPLVLGAGIALPLTDDREADATILVSAFYHF